MFEDNFQVSEKQPSRWNAIMLTASALLLIVTTSAVTLLSYDAWIKRDGWCVHSYPDGKQRILYGDDCKNLPNLG